MEMNVIRKRCCARVAFFLFFAVVVFSALRTNRTISLAKTRVTNSTVTYEKKGATLIIKGKGSMPGNMRFGTKKATKNIKKVVIRSGVTSVSDSAFKGCKKLQKVTLPSTVQKIGIESFSGTAIQTISLPKNLKLLGAGAFKGCKKLQIVKLATGYQCYGKGSEDRPIRVFDGVLKELHFLKPVKDLKTLPWLGFETYNYEMIDKEMNYAATEYLTEDGLIFTERKGGGYTLVYVPRCKKKVKIIGNCLAIDLSAFCHYVKDGVYEHCDGAVSILLPPWIYEVIPADHCGKGLPIDLSGYKLDTKSLAAFVSFLGVDAVRKYYPDRVKTEGEQTMIDGISLSDIIKKTNTDSTSADSGESTLVLGGGEKSFCTDDKQKKMYFAVDKRSEILVQLRLQNESLGSFQIQRRTGKKWITITSTDIQNSAESVQFIADPGKYRIQLRITSGKLDGTLQVTQHRKVYFHAEKSGRTKKKAASLQEREPASKLDRNAPQYYGFQYMTYNDANVKWMKFVKRKNAKGEFYIANCGVFGESPITVTIYKKGKQKPVKTYHIKGNNDSIRLLKVKGKGTYYIKLSRKTKKTTGAVLCGFQYD